MMQPAERYPFTVADTTLGDASARPCLPINLIHQGKSVSATGLLDTGAMVNVLPYRLGIDLGADWDEQTTLLQLTGNLAKFEASQLFHGVRRVLLSLSVGV